MGFVMPTNKEREIKSAITYTKGDEGWLGRLTSEMEQVYPKIIKVGELGKERVYVPERTCRPMNVTREDQNGTIHHFFHRCSLCGHDLPLEAEYGHCNYCSNCGAKVVY